jgi:hypothetical protein
MIVRNATICVINVVCLHLCLFSLVHIIVRMQLCHAVRSTCCNQRWDHIVGPGNIRTSNVSVPRFDVDALIRKTRSMRRRTILRESNVTHHSFQAATPNNIPQEHICSSNVMSLVDASTT